MGGSSSKDKNTEEETSSDFIDIEQENGSDELEIQAEEENYPPAPSEATTNLIQRYSPRRKRTVAFSVIDTSRSRRTLQTSRKEVPINYDNAIANAKQNINHKAETYESLMTDLTGSLATDKEKVYAITLWLSQQDIETGKFKLLKPDTPRGYMHLIQNRRGTFSSFFAQLCRKAGIPCSIVSGYSKSASYDVGEMNDEILKQNTNTWNTVFADNNWHIVHPYWVCRGLIGHKIGGYVKIEKGGQSVIQKETASEGQLTKCFNEYYIFTDPEEFVYRNIPFEEQSKWQLLPKPLTFDEYKHKPYVRPEFFQQKLKLTSKKDCILVAQNGLCNIEYTIPLTEANAINFTYELDMKIESIELGSQVGTSRHDGDNNNNPQNALTKPHIEDDNNNIRANIARYVIMMRSGIKQENVSFEVRLPKEGMYKISIYSGRDDEWGDDPPLTSSFRIVCDQLDSQCVPDMAPIDPGIVGWGPGPKAFKSGLLMPSHERGKIEVNVKQEVIIQFQVVTHLHVVINMAHNTKTNGELKQYFSYTETSSEFTERRELTVRACVPNKDEYAIRIGTCKNSYAEQPDYACNYLLSSKQTTHRGREAPLIKESRKKMKNALVSMDLDDIDCLLSRAEKFHLDPNDDDVRLLRRRRDFLKMKKMFRDVFLRNNIDVAERTIKKAENSQFAQVFQSDIANVQNMIQKLEDHDRWPHEVPDKNTLTLTEVSHMNAPPEKAQDVMKAVCVLIWDLDDDYMEWADTQAALKNKQKIIKKMKEMQNDESKLPNRKTMLKVKRLMKSISEVAVRKIDNSLVPFYLWVKDILKRFDDTESRKTESKQTSIVPPLQLQH